MAKISSDWVSLNCKISPEANALIRPVNRRKGDISKLVNEAILAKFATETALRALNQDLQDVQATS